MEGLLQKIEQSLRYNDLKVVDTLKFLRDANPFLLGDSSKLHHDDELKEAKIPDRFEEVMSKLKEFYSGIHPSRVFSSHLLRSLISIHSYSQRSTWQQFRISTTW